MTDPSLCQATKFITFQNRVTELTQHRPSWRKVRPSRVPIPSQCYLLAEKVVPGPFILQLLLSTKKLPFPIPDDK